MGETCSRCFSSSRSIAANIATRGLAGTQISVDSEAPPFGAPRTEARAVALHIMSDVQYSTRL